ncbi:hypothetical protein [Acrocarpospora sp. B8E8]|uniref:hypothetical protein n=1 Tax=Acrocarpospora sp. B8E8 TaxID=3153572 RepID=UPI00325D9A10
MGYPPQGQPPYGQQPYNGPYQPPQPPMMPPQYGYAPVQTMQVKERAFNPVTFGVHACLWFFVHSWLTFLTIGFWLFVAIPVTFIGWNVIRTVPVQQIPPGFTPR